MPPFLRKTALARLYWPDQSPATALRYLQRTIDDDPRLRRRLRALGWTPQTRLFTPRMLQAIYDALGRP